MSALDELRSWAKRLKRELFVLYLAWQDPRTPWHARILAIAVVAYALSPIDLIPDFIPILGYLDDLILLPIGIYFVIRAIPADVLAECRAKADEGAQISSNAKWIGGGMVLMVWILFLVLIMRWLSASNSVF